MNRERELKYAAQSSEPPRLPRGWSLGPERSVAEIVDSYLDHAATLITRGWALRKRETVGAPTRYTLKRNAQQVGAFHQRDEIEQEGDQIPAEIVHEIGAQLASKLDEVVTMRQRRRSWPLQLNGSVVADLTTDEIQSGNAQWTELEVEFVPSVSDADATEIATELQAFFAGDGTLTPSHQSKLETAIAAL
jgi:inorganic triphosphatase YgiF